VIDNKVYDITNYISMHPGGKRNILKGAFKDASDEFHKSHLGLDVKNTPLVLLEIGQINKDAKVNNQI
jgi:cytochrome b involved in lipid metabolism